jgi:catechol 2,3-dioxygenase-like lactoylglutathione lyase family enzyme
MLGNARLYVNLRAPDLDRVVEFYEGKLGLPLLERRETMPGHYEALFDAGGAVVCVEEGESVGPGAFTPLAFEVDDVDSTVASLRAGGVTPEDYDLPYLRTVDGVATIGSFKAAWITDPGGNLVGLLSGGARS